MKGVLQWIWKTKTEWKALYDISKESEMGVAEGLVNTVDKFIGCIIGYKKFGCGQLTSWFSKAYCEYIGTRYIIFI